MAIYHEVMARGLKFASRVPCNDRSDRNAPRLPSKRRAEVDCAISVVAGTVKFAVGIREDDRQCSARLSLGCPAAGLVGEAETETGEPMIIVAHRKTEGTCGSSTARVQQREKWSLGEPVPLLALEGIDPPPDLVAPRPAVDCKGDNAIPNRAVAVHVASTAQPEIKCHRVELCKLAERGQR